MKWIDNMIRKEEIETREEMDRNEWFVNGRHDIIMKSTI